MARNSSGSICGSRLARRLSTELPTLAFQPPSRLLPPSATQTLTIQDASGSSITFGPKDAVQIVAKGDLTIEGQKVTIKAGSCSLGMETGAAGMIDIKATQVNID